MQPNYCVQKTTDSKLVLLYAQLKQTVKFIAYHCVYNTVLLDDITNRNIDENERKKKHYLCCTLKFMDTQSC